MELKHELDYTGILARARKKLISAGLTRVLTNEAMTDFLYTVQ